MRGRGVSDGAYLALRFEQAAKLPLSLFILYGGMFRIGKYSEYWEGCGALGGNAYCMLF